MAAPSRSRFILVATALYGIGAFAWIFGSEMVVVHFGTPETAASLSLLKGSGFVLVTTIALFFLLQAVPGRDETWPESGEAPEGRRSAPWPVWAALLFAIGAVIATLLVRLAIAVPIASLPLLILFVPAIVASALLGGLLAGVFASALSVGSVALVLLPAGGIPVLGWGYDLLILFVSGGLISLASELMHRRRHRAEARRQMYRVTLDSIGDAVIVTDLVGIVTFLNPAAEALTGWSRDEALGRPLARVFSILSASDRHLIADPVARVIGAVDLAGRDEPLLLVGRDGREWPVTGRATAIRDRAGRLFGVVLTFEDCSERRAAELSLAAERRLLRTLLDTLPDLIWLKDVEGRFLICNRMFERFVGHTEAEILGATDYDLVESTLADTFRANDRRAMSAGMPVSNEEWISFADDGHRVLLETIKTPMPGEAGAVVGVLGVGRDITARWAAEGAVRRSADKLARLAASVPGMLYEYGEEPDGRVRLLYVSDYCRELFGIEPEAALDDIGVVRRMIVPEDWPRMDREQRIAIDARRPISIDVRIIAADGRRKWVQFSSSPGGSDRDGMTHLRSGVALDITGRVLAEAAVREKDALLREMSRLAHIGAWSLDLSSGDVEVTEEVARIHEMEPEEVASVDQGLSRFQGEHRRQLEDALAAAREHGHPYDLELEMQAPSGGRKWVRAIGAPVMEQGRVVAIRGTLQDVTERKLAALQLGAVEARLRLFIENAPVALAMLDREMRYLVVSQRWLSDYRLTNEQIIGVSHYEVFPDIPERWKEIHRRCLAGASEKCDEDPFPRGDGRIDWLRWEVLSWREAEGGEVGGLLILSENITERVQARETVRKLSLAIEQSPNGVQITNAEGVIEYVNAALLAMTGYERDELIGQNPTVLSSGLTPANTYAELWQSMAEGRPWQGELVSRRKNGEIFIEFDRISPLRNGEGEITHYLAIKDDITERKRTAQELELYRHHLEEVVALRTADLRAAEAKWRLILESSGDGLFGIDAEGVLTFANSAACTLLDTRPDELIGRNAHLALHHSHADHRAYAEASCPATLTLRDGVTRRVEDEVFWRLDGSSFPVSYSVHPIKQDGSIIGAVVSFTDVTAQLETSRAREAALSEAQRLAQVRRDFLANMSHEIRTPLNAVLGLAQLGRGDAQLGERPRSLFARILDAGETLLDVVNDILDFSKIEAGKVRAERVPLVLGVVIDRAIALVASRAREKGLRMRIEEAPDLPARIEGDPARLTQVLGNLLSNAVKFTPSGGSVALTVTAREGWLVIAVSDSGIGMSSEQIGRLFQPFEQADSSTTRHFGGSGLGLSISRHLLTLMKGEIAVESALGHGTRFTVQVPLLALPEALPPAEPTTVALIGLGAEGSEDLAWALRARGCAVTLAGGLDPLPDAAILVVGGATAMAGSGVLRKLAALGRKVALALDPLSAGRLPAELAGQAVVLDWPWRARHVLADGAAIPAVGGGGSARPLAGLRVLAAEDNEVNRLVLAEMLTVTGAVLAEAANGREALEIVERAGAAAFDLVLTDIQMPEMDGYDLARHLARVAPALPVIGITAHAMPEEEERCRAAGMVAQVTKPVHLERLVAVILSWVAPPTGREGMEGEKYMANVPEEASPRGGGVGVDWAALSHHYQGRMEFIGRLAASVRETHAATAAGVRAAGRSGDAKALAALAHKVKGTAGNLFAAGLVQQAAEVERQARAEAGPAVELAAAAEALADAVEVMLADVAAHGEAGRKGTA